MTVRNAGATDRQLHDVGVQRPTRPRSSTRPAPRRSRRRRASTRAPRRTSASRSTVPAGAANGDVNTATVKATSVADPAVSGTAIVKTIAVAVDTLLVDEDTNAPIDSQPIYKAALTDAGVPFSTWDLAADADLPAELPEGVQERRLVHRQQLPRPAAPVREPAEGVPGRRRAPVRLRAGHPRPGGGHDAVRPRLPAHHVGRDGDPERQGDRRPCTASPDSLADGSAPCRSTTRCWRPSSRTRSRRTAAPRRRSPTTPAQTDALPVRGRVQGRVPRLPDGGVRHGGPAGRPDEPRVRLLRVLTGPSQTSEVNERGRSHPSPLLFCADAAVRVILARMEERPCSASRLRAGVLDVACSPGAGARAEPQPERRPRESSWSQRPSALARRRRRPSPGSPGPW